MSEWDELVLQDDSLDVWPEPSVARFVSYLYSTFDGSSLRIWDLGCGQGRHTVALSSLGLDVYASDYSQNAIDRTKQALEQQGLHATLAQSAMYEFPFDTNQKFEGIVCWNALQHNTFEGIRKTVQLMTDHLVPGGCVLLAVASTMTPEADRGTKVEEGGYVLEKGREKGVLHHFFSEDELRDLFDEDYWVLPAMAENIVLYHSLDSRLSDPHIFRSTAWLVLAQRK